MHTRVKYVLSVSCSISIPHGISIQISHFKCTTVSGCLSLQCLLVAWQLLLHLPLRNSTSHKKEVHCNHQQVQVIERVSFCIINLAHTHTHTHTHKENINQNQHLSLKSLRIGLSIPAQGIHTYSSTTQMHD